MKHRLLLAAYAAFALLLAPGPKASAADVSISLRIGDPYRGPRLAFVQEPDVVVIPGTRVYYIDDYDYDLYRYGSYWYYYYDGGWYRSVDYDGPFYFISYQTVPRSIRYVPVRYRHHWRSYRGPAYSYYRAGRYYRSNPGRYTNDRSRTYDRSSPTRYSRDTDRRDRYTGQHRYRQQPAQQERQYRRGQAPPGHENRGGGDRGGGNKKERGKGRDQGGGHGHGHGG